MTTPHVLIAEDNPADATVITDTLQHGPTTIRLTVTDDGRQALDHLNAIAGDPQLLPKLIILDLNLPGLTGHELLTEIRNHPALRLVPTLILSSSASATDVTASYQLGANCHLKKPIKLAEYRQLIDHIHALWLTHAPPLAAGSR